MIIALRMISRWFCFAWIDGVETGCCAAAPKVSRIAAARPDKTRWRIGTRIIAL
jgi:hypothetical protein